MTAVITVVVVVTLLVTVQRGEVTDEVDGREEIVKTLVLLAMVMIKASGFGKERSGHRSRVKPRTFLGRLKISPKRFSFF